MGNFSLYTDLPTAHYNPVEQIPMRLITKYLISKRL